MSSEIYFNQNEVIWVDGSEPEDISLEQPMKAGIFYNQNEVVWVDGSESENISLDQPMKAGVFYSHIEVVWADRSEGGIVRSGLLGQALIQRSILTKDLLPSFTAFDPSEDI